MAVNLKNCIFVAAAGGLGDFSVASAVAGKLTPAQAGAEDGLTYEYRAGLGSAWEYGNGDYQGDPPKLRRLVVTQSSNNNQKVDFAAPPQVTVMNAINVPRITPQQYNADIAKIHADIGNADQGLGGHSELIAALRAEVDSTRRLLDALLATKISIFLGRQIVTATGSSTITIPAFATACDLMLLGGGGGAASGTYGSENPAGAGARLHKRFTGLVGGKTLALVVGTGGQSGGYPSDGTATTLSSGTQTIDTLTANGGHQGGYNGAGVGGIATGGDLNIQGESGWYFTWNISGNYYFAGIGGSTLYGAGGRPGADKNAASGYGAGAGSPTLSGDNGRPGLAIFDWYNFDWSMAGRLLAADSLTNLSAPGFGSPVLG